MSRPTGITIIQVVLLAAAIGCGAAGVDRLRNPPGEVTVQLLDYAIHLTETVQRAVAYEAQLRREGRDEEVYIAVDNKLNAELDWRDSTNQLRKRLGPDDFARLEAYDFVEQPDELHAELTSLRFWKTSSVPQTVLLSLAGGLMLLALVLKPLARVVSRPAGQTAGASPAADQPDEATGAEPSRSA